jgi:hypothetical protein
MEVFTMDKLYHMCIERERERERQREIVQSVTRGGFTEAEVLGQLSALHVLKARASRSRPDQKGVVSRERGVGFCRPPTGPRVQGQPRHMRPS